MAAEFVDHYAVLGCSHDVQQEDLKRLYFEKLREFHPDKRPNSPDGSTGQRVTQELTQAWEVLRDEAARKAYNERWEKEKEAAMPPSQRADMYRRKGNQLYVEGRDIQKANDGKMSFSSTRESMGKFMAAIEFYTKAIDVAAYDHRFWSNRALCYAAVEDWRRCKDDAMQCAKLKPDFMKGWFLLAKSLYRMGDVEDARRELESGLRACPGSAELTELRGELFAEPTSPSLSSTYGPGRGANRSVSPGMTPPMTSRTLGGTPPQSYRMNLNATAPMPGAPLPGMVPGMATPPRNGSCTPPRNGAATPPSAFGGMSPPRKSPSLAGAAASSSRMAQEWVASSRNNSQPGSRNNSKSPGPGWRGGGLDSTLEATGQTGAFGMPTPSFAAGAGPVNFGQTFGQTFGSTVKSAYGATLGGTVGGASRGATPPRR